MKRIIYSFVLASLLISCGEEKTETQNEETTHEEAVIETNELNFEYLKELDQKLVKDDMSVDAVVGKELMNSARQFVAENPNHEDAEAALELAAKGAEGAKLYNEAIGLLHRLITEFDESDKTPSYMYNKARILEEKLGKKDNAKAAYQALIDRFPEDPLALAAQEYVQMGFADMSDDEIIKMLEEKNQ